VKGFSTFAVKLQKLMMRFESFGLPNVDCGLRSIKTICRVAGKLLKIHGYDENITMAIATKLVMIYQLDPEERTKFYHLTAQAFLGPNVKAAKKLMNFTTTTQIDVIRSQFNEVFEAKSLRHSVHLRTDDEDITDVATKLSDFLQTNSSEEASVFMFSLDEDEETLFGDDGLFAVSMKSGSTDPSKAGYIVVYTQDIGTKFDCFFNKLCDDNKKLKTTGGNMIKLGENQTVIFVTGMEDETQMSPAFVSRTGKAFHVC